MPETLLFIHQNTPIKQIIGLDNSYDAILIARKIICSLHMKTINVRYGDGRFYDYTDADIVYIP